MEKTEQERWWRIRGVAGLGREAGKAVPVRLHLVKDLDRGEGGGSMTQGYEKGCYSEMEKTKML